MNVNLSSILSIFMVLVGVVSFLTLILAVVNINNSVDNLNLADNYCITHGFKSANMVFSFPFMVERKYYCFGEKLDEHGVGYVRITSGTFTINDITTKQLKGDLI